MKTQTKQVIAEIGKDARRELTKAGMATLRGLEQVACKASYPVLGNLSANLQYGIQNALGEKYYNAKDATKTSYVTNTLAYSAMVGYSAYKSGDSNPHIVGITLFGTIGGAVAGAKEYAHRMDYPVCASLLGKIVSLPIEGIINTYSAGKKYLQNVKERVRLNEEKDKEKIDAQKSNSFPTDNEEFDRQFANGIGEGIRKIPLTEGLTTALVDFIEDKK